MALPRQVVGEDENNLVEVQPVATKREIEPGVGFVEGGNRAAQVEDSAGVLATLADALCDCVGRRVGGLGLDGHRDAPTASGSFGAVLRDASLKAPGNHGPEALPPSLLPLG